jgi:Domain of unknown function (DUF4157)
MAESSSSATLEAPKSTSTAHSPVREIQRTNEPELDRSSILGQRAISAIGGGSPETPPDRFAGALGQVSGSSQVGMLRQMQHSYGNSYVGRVIQRKCDCGGSCANCQEKKLQHKGEGILSAVPEGFEAGMQRSGAGSSLDMGTRSFMESRFGQDFSDVRVHTDDAAAEAARLVQAQAFTTGRDIYFGRNRYQPQTREGQKLLAHELTHTIQQSDGGSGLQTASVLSDPGDRYEQEADAIADRVVAGEPVNATAITSLGQAPIQRYSWEEFVSDLESAGEAVVETAEDVGEVVVEAGEAVVETAEEVYDELADAVDTVLDVGEAVYDALANGIVITLPDVTLFDRAEYNTDWNDSTGEIPLLEEVVEIPYVGPVLLVLYAQGEANADFTAGIGPIVLQNIELTLAPFDLYFSGTAQLVIPADALVGFTLTGIIGTHADWLALIEVARLLGGLDVSGGGGALTSYSVTLAVTYDDGEFSLDITDDLEFCVRLGLSLDAFAELLLLEESVWAEEWDLAQWGWEECWELIATVSISPDGIEVDLEIDELDADLVLRQLFDGATRSELLGEETEEPGVGVAGNCIANDNLGETADSFISRCRKASIRSEFPGELLSETLGNIKKGKTARHKKAWKLLNDNRFKKPGVTIVSPPTVTPPGVVPPGISAKSNRVRFQLQHKSNEVVPAVPIEKDSSVTVAEGKDAVDTLLDRASKSVYKACEDAGKQMKKTVDGYPPQGVDAIGNVARKWCKDHPDYERGIRLDLENLAGKNFTS